jgi:ubiquinone/menaquinone biosynthesis C-methylase UbiE
MSDATNHNAQIVSQFSQQAASYTQLTTSLAKDRSKALWALLQPRDDDLALEVCCGPGTLALQIAPSVRHVTGMDLTPAMLEQARMRQTSIGVENVTWMIGDVNAIPYEDMSFSIVMCSSAFHHIKEPGEAFREMIRVCRPGGRILIKDVTPAPDKAEQYDAIEKMRDPSHAHALTVNELRALGSGLAIDEITIATNVTPKLPLEAVLATSFPETCSLDDLRALLREDAASGADRFGL